MEESNTTVVLRPLDSDIICGSGTIVSTHPGNKRFRAIVAKHFRAYATATNKGEKMRITQEVMDCLCLAPSAGCTRFLKRDPIFERYHVAGKRAGRDKVSHCLREMKVAEARMRRQHGWQQLRDSSKTNTLSKAIIEEDWGLGASVRATNTKDATGLTMPGAVLGTTMTHVPTNNRPEFVTATFDNQSQAATTELPQLQTMISSCWDGSFALHASSEQRSRANSYSALQSSTPCVVPAATSSFSNASSMSLSHSPNLAPDECFNLLISSVFDPIENTVQKQEHQPNSLPKLSYQMWDIELPPSPQQQLPQTNKNNITSQDCWYTATDNENFASGAATIAVLENPLLTSPFVARTVQPMPHLCNSYNQSQDNAISSTLLYHSTEDAGTPTNSEESIDVDSLFAV